MKYTYTLLILFLTFLYCPLLAQNTKFHLLFESTLGVSDRIFVNDGSYSERDLAHFSNLETPRFGFDVGMLAEYEISKKVSLQAGLRYTRWGHQANLIHIMSHFPDPLIPDYYKKTRFHHYLEMPIRLNYFINFKRGRLFIRGGYFPSINFSNQTIETSIFKNRVYREDATEIEVNEDTNQDYSRINLIGEFGFGWEQDISKKISLIAGPNCRIQTLGILEDAQLNRKLFFYGFSFGLKLK